MSAHPAHPLPDLVQFGGADAEAADQVEQFVGVGRQRFGPCGGFFRYCRIVLGGRISC